MFINGVLYNLWECFSLTHTHLHYVYKWYYLYKVQNTKKPTLLGIQCCWSWLTWGKSANTTVQDLSSDESVVNPLPAHLWAYMCAIKKKKRRITNREGGTTGATLLPQVLSPRYGLLPVKCGQCEHHQNPHGPAYVRLACLAVTATEPSRTTSLHAGHNNLREGQLPNSCPALNQHHPGCCSWWPKMIVPECPHVMLLISASNNVSFP